MRILVVTDTILKQELLPNGIPEGLQIDFIDSIGTSEPYDACIDLLFDNNVERIEWLKNLQVAIMIVNSVNTTLQHLPASFVRINGWPTLLQARRIEAAGGIELRSATDALFQQLGKEIEWVSDVSGFVSCRVISSIINEAFYTLQEQVSTVDEINTAMKLGTNYPYGPFEWAGKIGLIKIYSLLAKLSEEQSRYQPAPLLKQKALA